MWCQKKEHIGLEGRLDKTRYQKGNTGQQGKLNMIRHSKMASFLLSQLILPEEEEN